MRSFVTIFSLLFISVAFAQAPAYLTQFDSKVYSLKAKGIKDFSVDIRNSKLTKQLNEQMMFGKVTDLYFRVHWTASPERLAIEVEGLPEGFKEVREELKLAIMPQMDHLIPQTMAQKFAGYKLAQGSSSREYVATDTTGIAAVPGYTLKFDVQDRLVEIVGKKPIGSLSIVPKYEKTSFSDGRWVLNALTTTNSEGGQTLISKKELSYGSANGIGVLTKIESTTEQRSEAQGAKPLISEDELEFKNYKINQGTAMKYFLGEQSKNSH